MTVEPRISSLAGRCSAGDEGPASTAGSGYGCLSDDEFARLASLARETSGIVLTAAKRPMLQARIQKRLRALGLKTYGAYCRHLFSREKGREELVEFLNVVTTNKTDFFREPHHFDHLVAEALPSLLAQKERPQGRPVKVWSAGCSSGEEPYTLAMLLAEFTGTHPGFSWSVLGTDISTRVLEKAILAVYAETDVEPVPLALRTKYLLRSKDRSRGLVRITPEIRERVEFRHLNFMQKVFDIPKAFEVIFCRNAIIYFDRQAQLVLLRRLFERLIPGGFLFLGHSESLNGFPLPFETVGPTIYKKPLGRA